MKSISRFLILLGLVMIQYQCLSQVTYEINKKKYICYTTEENRILGYSLQENLQRDTLLTIMDFNMALLKSKVLLVEQKFVKADSLYRNESVIVDHLNVKNKQLTLYRNIFGVTTVLLSLILIL